MPNNNKQEAKLTMIINSEDGKTAERVIEGAGNIAYILEEAGILDDELGALLGYS